MDRFGLLSRRRFRWGARPRDGAAPKTAAGLNGLALVAVLVLAAALRLHGLEWDGGQWLQPDERQIYFVTLGLEWPRSGGEALSDGSPLNPHFFAYGSLVFYLLKLFAAALAPLWSAVRDPDNLHLAGRLLAVLADVGTIAFTYRLGRTVWWAAPGAKDRGEGRRRALGAAALASVTVLSIQQAHFYTADVLLTFLVVLALNLAMDAVHRGRGRAVALGLVVGLGLATKVSAAPLLIVALVALRPAGGTRSDGFSRFRAAKAATTRERRSRAGSGSAETA